MDAISLFVMVGVACRYSVRSLALEPRFRRKIYELAEGICHRRLVGGALQWHLTFMWIDIASGLIYVGYQLFTATLGRYCSHGEMFMECGRWSGTISFFGPTPEQREPYNALQKQAYTTAIVLGLLSVLTGFAIWKPVQFSWLAWLMGGFHLARLWHFLVMWAMVGFVFGHLVMVILHGWNNFVSMLTGWKKDPEILRGRCDGRVESGLEQSGAGRHARAGN